MSEQEKKRQRIYDLLNAETKPKFLCLTYTKQRNFFTLKEIFEAKGVEDKRNNEKKRLLTVLLAASKYPTTSIRKRANEFKVQQKTVKTAIKQD